MKAVVAAFKQEKALVGAFSVITNFRMDFFEALILTLCHTICDKCFNAEIWQISNNAAREYKQWYTGTETADTRTMFLVFAIVPPLTSLRAATDH